MIFKKHEKKNNMLLLIITALLLMFIQYGLKSKDEKIKTKYYKEMIIAAKKMKIFSEEIKKEKIKIGIQIDKSLDINETGLIGEEWSGITTTLGSLESKRTSTDPDFAALMVKLFKENNLKKGDSIAVNLSSSFPALNLAFLAAADTIGLNAVIVNSVGASTYGANLENFTYLDMENLLYSKGLLKNKSIAYSLGGEYDTGKNLDETAVKNIKERNTKYGLHFFYNEDLNANINERYEFYKSKGNIKAFINIGGNLLSFGNASDIIINSNVLLEENLNIKDGLIGKFLTEKIPVYHFLNLKGITTNFGMFFDSYPMHEIGISSIYFEENSNFWNYMIITIFLIFIFKIIFNEKTLSFKFSKKK